MTFDLQIENGSSLQSPLVLDGVQWTTARRGVPGKLTFSVVKDDSISFQEGNAVSLKVDGQNLFYGFVFTKKRDKEGVIEVTAYDQLRYLKNKDTYVYISKKASDVIKMIAADFNLQVGELEDTSFLIPHRSEPNVTLMDIICTALDLELTNAKKLFVFYDDFGKLTLKSLDNLKVDLLINEETGENYDYTSTIDDSTYDKVKLIYENPDTGKRDVYIAQDGQHINDWGILQYFDTLQSGENGKAKADALLSLYNSKTRKLSIKNALGDTRVRAGSMPIVSLNLGDVTINNYMLVERCVHTFNESEHWMDLTLRGGEFVG